MFHACEENCDAQGWELAGQIDELNATISSLESMNSTLQSERNNFTSKSICIYKYSSRIKPRMEYVWFYLQ